MANWSSGSDWDSSQSEQGVYHDSWSSTDHDDAGTVRHGYSIDNAFLSSDLAGYYPLQEDSGSTISGFWGGSDGTANGGTPNQTGIGSNSSWYFDGSGDNADLPIGSSVFQGNYTITVWYNKPNSNTGNLNLSALNNNSNVVIAYGDNDNNGGIEYFINSRGSGTSCGDQNLGNNEWVFIAAVHENGNHKLYINGTDYGSFSGSVNNTTDSTLLAERAIGGNMEVKLTELRIYNKGLSQFSIQKMYDFINTDGSYTTSKEYL